MKKYTIKILVLLIMICRQSVSANAQGRPTEGKVKIAIALSLAGKNDTIALQVFPKPLIVGDYGEAVVYKAVADQNGRFKFEFPASPSGTYFNVKLYRWIGSGKDTTVYDKMLSEGNIAEPEDNVELIVHPRPGIKDREVIAEYEYLISGNGANKYRFKHALDSLALSMYTAKCFRPDGIYDLNNGNNKLISNAVSFSGIFKNSITGAVYDKLLSDWLFKRKNTELGILKNKVNALNEVQRGNFFKHVELLDTIFRNTFSVNDMADSFNMPSYFIRLENFKKNETQSNPDATYWKIKQNYSGVVRDRLICALFRLSAYHFINFNDVFNDATTVIKTPFYAGFLSKFKSRRTGEIAYDFHLKDTKGTFVNFHDFAGKIVMIDFWFTGCSYCSYFYKEHLSKVEKHFSGNDMVVFVTINIDRRREQWLSSINSGMYTSPEVINLNTGIEGNTHAVVNYYKVLSYPQPMIIDPKGRVQLFGDAEHLTYSDLIAKIDQLLVNKN